MENLEDRIIDVLSGVCPTFKVGNHKYKLYPKTLGKMYLFDRLRANMGIDSEAMKRNPLLETLRICTQKKELVLRMLAYVTLHGKDNVFDETLVESRIKAFGELENEELATLVLSVLMDNDINDFIKYFQIHKDDENRRKIAKVKKSGNTVSFGGRSIWGTIIDFACARYGWTFDYVVWEISYTNLMMLYRDKPDTIHLTDKERKSVHLRTVGEVINGDDPKNIGKIMKMFS